MCTLSQVCLYEDCCISVSTLDLCLSLGFSVLERQQKLRTQIVYNGLPKFLGGLLHAYLHPLLGADELSG
jgi:hypothetical protein